MYYKITIGLFLTLAVAAGAFFADQKRVEAPIEHDHSDLVEVVAVLDGDTIEVLIDGMRERVRYIGIDTPERAHEGATPECFSDEATAMNEKLVADASVRLVPDTEDRDEYGRLLRYVYTKDDVFVNKELIEGGYARALTIPPNTQFWKSFTRLEDEAAERGLVLWSACN